MNCSAVMDRKAVITMAAAARGGRREEEGAGGGGQGGEDIHVGIELGKTTVCHDAVQLHGTNGSRAKVSRVTVSSS